MLKEYSCGTFKFGGGIKASDKDDSRRTIASTHFFHFKFFVSDRRTDFFSPQMCKTQSVSLSHSVSLSLSLSIVEVHFNKLLSWFICFQDFLGLGTTLASFVFDFSFHISTVNKSITLLKKCSFLF